MKIYLIIPDVFHELLLVEDSKPAKSFGVQQFMHFFLAFGHLVKILLGLLLKIKTALQVC